jgi:peptidoglycan/xylan/chitin deacetylase (PgdA/CDA1 family)
MRQLMAKRAAPLIVLFYHRVADHDLSPWTITREDFRRHLDFVGKTHEWISLEEVQRRVRENDSPRPAVHLTFDDGYGENFEFAVPEVVRRRIPSTYFVTLHQVLTGEPFEHDRKRGSLIRPNTPEELRQIARDGVELGAHTRNHVDIGKVTCPNELRSEVNESASELSRLVGEPIRYFAFPYGLPHNITSAAIAEVARSGMSGFCSAFGGYNLPGRDPFHIRRIHGDPGLVRLRNWLSFDSWKVRREPIIPYQPSLLPRSAGIPVLNSKVHA